ncbi:NmrA family NAD(P)-binding protein [Bradyrhizobium sp. UFLA01-814]|uniref:NmrA family NAD(P)-binding protein n=1 Tax=Bradyrhizobium sp. UFLA01-814 TaxID=3023480 RepID=UPI00398A6A0C
MTVLVVGATGKVAGQLVSNLQNEDIPLRLLVRNGEKAKKAFGEETSKLRYVIGQLADEKVLEVAFSGVDVAFLGLGTSQEQEALERGLIDAVGRHATAHVVRLSVLASNAEATYEVARRHGALDAHLEKSGLSHTLLKPSYFMSNLLLAAASISSSSRWYGAIPTGLVAMIDTRDVGDAAAAVIRDPSLRGSSYDLTGPQAVSLPEAAEFISATVGRSVQYVSTDEDALRKGYAARGVPAWLADYALGIDRGMQAGDHAKVTQTVRTLTGKPPRTLQAFLAENKSAFAPV